MPISPGMVREWSGHASEQVQGIYTHQLKRGVVRLGERVEYRIGHFLGDPAVEARYERVRDACMPWCLRLRDHEKVPPVVPNSGRSFAVA